ncbi:MAG: WbqC family protein [Flavobacteriales bacterium]|nr:MAG: WbqC family protein [Flavobacteriales bacterium]
MSLPLLPAFYFGSVEHYRLLAQHPRVLIDIGEHYERQSYRTRTGIVGPNGRQDLSVHIVHDHGNKIRMRDVRLSYAETWPQQHLHAIRSAYGQTPWFIHYIDDIEQVLLAKHERLTDLLLATLQLGLRWLQLRTDISVSDQYVEGPEFRSDEMGLGPVDPATPLAQRLPMIDLRMSFHPKRPLPAEVTAVPPYPQVFADRHGFVPRLSLLDLVCNCGPDAAARVMA